MRAAGAILALALLAGCSALPKPGAILPPATLLADCPEPPAVFTTNGELADYALELRTALRLCNNDKAALREWIKEPT